MSRLPVHVARHFWRNGEFAVWDASADFPSALLVWLKSHYSELVAGERPHWVDLPEGRLFLLFMDEHEVHGRLATKLTACWLEQTVKDPVHAFEQIREAIESIDNDTLTTEIKVRVVKEQGCMQNRFVIGGITLIICVVVALWFSLSSPNKKNSDEQATIDVVQPMNKSAPLKQDGGVEETHKKAAPKLGICAALPRNVQYCFQIFLSEKCNHRTSLNYDEWLSRLKINRPMKFMNNSCPPDLKHDEDVRRLDKQADKKWQHLRGILK